MKMPEPTKTASAPSWRTSAASAGVAIPPAEKFGTGSLPERATMRTNSQLLQNLCFCEVSNAAFGHYGDGNRVHDLANLLRRGHPGDSAFSADLRGDAFKCHDCYGAGAFSNFRLLGVRNVHDDAAL